LTLLGTEAFNPPNGDFLDETVAKDSFCSGVTKVDFIVVAAMIC
jgi:hypothetical protein